MSEFDLNDYASLATIAGTIGAGVVFTFKKLNIKNKNNKSPEGGNINHEGTQIVTNDGANITISGGINNNINQVNKKIPDALAKPSIYIKQVGFRNGGYPHKTCYTLQVTNMGGNFFNLQVIFLNKIICSLATLDRGSAFNLTLNLPERPPYISLSFKGLDGNGEEVHISLNGTLTGPTNSEYTFIPR